MTHRYLLAGTAALFLSGLRAQSVPGSQKDAAQALSRFTAAAESRLQGQRAQVARLKSQGYREFISDGLNDRQLVGADEAGRPLYYTTLNAGAAKMTKASSLYAGSAQLPSITGAGMAVGQWDYSKPRDTHELLSGKVTYPASQNQAVSRHSTNIAGTVAGNNGDPEARGIAFGATLRAYDWVDDVLEMRAEAYDPGANPGGVVVANNSYGFDPMYLQSYQFGKYNPTARDWDALMFLRPRLQIVKAAGNAREADPAVVPQVAAKGGYDLLEGAGVSKNVIVVASAKKNAGMTSDEDYSVSAFSSYGPSDDGRIKPDLCAPGEDIYSSIETYDQAYGTYRGTSSATAVVSGVAALLEQYWRQLHTEYMLSSTLRAILAHTANDRGTVGPDYIYGWGLVDAQRAASAIYNNIEGSTNQEKKTTLIKEAVLPQGSQYVLYVTPYDLAQPLSATLAWTDPEGPLPDVAADSPARSLVNDLDIRISKVNADGSEAPYFPWKLGGMQDRLSPATRSGTNDMDNLERVDIDASALSKTTYKITVSAKSKTTPLLPSGSQQFSLVVSNVDFCYMDDFRVLSSPADDIATTTVIKAKEITASNKVLASAQGVEYVASRSVTLLPDFHAEQGSGFHAYITPCFDLTSSMKYAAQKRVGATADVPVPAQPGGQPAGSESPLVIYPNPASGEFNIKFWMAATGGVKISIYDASGRLVKEESSSRDFPQGEFVKTVGLSGLSSGMYVVVFQAGSFRESKKLIIK